MSDILEYVEKHAALFAALGAILPVVGGLALWIFKIIRPPKPPEGPEDRMARVLQEEIEILMLQLGINRPIRPSDSMSVRNEGQMQQVKQLGTK